ncbi:KAT8 regulatory NSL complex subunit 1 [Trichomycterus rosablanca]|uniref:KAT8 regulatory NSL complex subunit 1 n=1 Tax=Trichomycterus rosablanca TaxID=2290929 RepID=UPI002F3518F2
MAAMAPALTDAPSEARHIRLKLAAESNGSSANLLLSSSVSPADTAGADGRRRRRCNGAEPLAEPLSLGKLQPLVASYLCSHVAPVAEEGVLIKPSALKRRGLLNGDLLLRQALSGGQPKALANGGAATGGGGGTMVPVNALAKKVAVPSTALPEKGSVATVNGDNAKPPASARSLLQVSSKSGGVAPAFSTPNGDSRPEHALRRVSEATDVNDSSVSPAVKSKAPPSGRSHHVSDEALRKANCSNPEHPDPPQSPAPPRSAPRPCSSTPSSGVEALLLRERVQQSQRRQTDVSARLQRLCKRLQVVQAKQVERHVHQQLSGFSRHARTAPLPRDGSVAPELDELHLSGTAGLHAAEARFDSDATESSSGGESDVEEEELSRADIQQRHIKLWRRAEGRLALERASIISRWTWLQAHISDLEYRIRQQSDILRQIRAGKGVVELESPCSSADPARTERVEDQVSQSGRGDMNPASRCDEPYNRLLYSAAEPSEPSDAAASSSSDGGCSTARVRALISCKRRRLVQPGTFQALNSKVPKMCSQTRPCDINPWCWTCGNGWRGPTRELEFRRPLVERVSLLDYSIHPSLSLRSDVPLAVLLQKALKSPGRTRHTEKPEPPKKPPLRHELYSASSLSALSRHKFRLSSSHRAAIRSASHKSRSERSRKHQSDAGVRSPKMEAQTPCRPGRVLHRGLGRRRLGEDSSERTRVPKLEPDAESWSPSQPGILPTTPALGQMCQPSDSSTPLPPGAQSGSCSVPVRKRRGENSFDINNIVIPMSVAATTRVEKLQYKEIITPSWREVDVTAQPLADEDDCVEVEDMSDGAFTQLHQRCEDQERSRWRWNALAPAKRRGSRSYKSLDGGTTPSTPQPSSPDTGHFHALQDYGPFPSPLSPPSPDTPCSRDAHTPSSKDSHTPQTRDAQRPACGEDTRCSTPDCTYEEKTVQPWERRSFPLPEEPEAPEPRTKPRPHQRPDRRPDSESEALSP